MKNDLTDGFKVLVTHQKQLDKIKKLCNQAGVEFVVESKFAPALLVFLKGPNNNFSCCSLKLSIFRMCSNQQVDAKVAISFLNSLQPIFDFKSGDMVMMRNELNKKWFVGIYENYHSNIEKSFFVNGMSYKYIAKFNKSFLRTTQKISCFYTYNGMMIYNTPQ